ncbi:hypothetical protein J2D73_14220 [Acetobacter sacchari]|uniref:Plasmid recombination enzyme n=1 Tax=Acetobacter sacchari TaxID=2661687 RepID=A0ABS3LYF4_9PROT|nr:hypothetical protein [Acetobacter sacchari]MBO1360942.1 hypothetical protein [Acetobacter sacchari]
MASYPGGGMMLEWQRGTVRWLQRQFGAALRSVIRHDDESYPHLHAYVLPTTPNMRAADLHPGARAKRRAMDAGASNKAGDIAYKEAMRLWQDSYWQDVGARCGLERIGPARQRLSRAEWRTADRVNRLLRDHEAKLQSVRRLHERRMDREYGLLQIVKRYIPKQAWDMAMARAEERIAEIEPNLSDLVHDTESGLAPEPDFEP